MASRRQEGKHEGKGKRGGGASTVFLSPAVTDYRGPAIWAEDWKKEEEEEALSTTMNSHQIICIIKSRLSRKKAFKKKRKFGKFHLHFLLIFSCYESDTLLLYNNPTPPSDTSFSNKLLLTLFFLVPVSDNLCALNLWKLFECS